MEQNTEEKQETKQAGQINENLNQTAFQPDNGQNSYGPGTNQPAFQPNNSQNSYGPGSNQTGYRPNNVQSGYEPGTNQTGYRLNNVQSGYGPGSNQTAFQPGYGQSAYGPGSNQPNFGPNPGQYANQPNFGPIPNQYANQPNYGPIPNQYANQPNFGPIPNQYANQPNYGPIPNQYANQPNFGPNPGQYANQPNFGPNPNPNWNPYAQPLGRNAYQQRYSQPQQRQNGSPDPAVKGFEKAIGKNLMSVLASLLIFTGLILLVKASYEYFGDAMRIVMMYLVSFFLLGGGAAGFRKYKNPFFLSLAGCGTGAVYLSLFLMYGYFHACSIFVLYALLLLWSVGVYVFGGRASLLFKVISQMGIMTALVYGDVSVYTDLRKTDTALFLATLILFYIVFGMFYLMMEKKSSFASNVTALVLNMAGCFLLGSAAFSLHYSYLYDSMSRPELAGVAYPLAVSLGILAYMFFLLVLYVKRIENAEGRKVSSVGWCFYATAALLNSLWCYGICPDDADWIAGAVTLLFTLALLILNEVRGKSAGFMIWMTVPFLVASCNHLGTLSDIVGIEILVFPYLLLGFFQKKKRYLFVALFFAWLYLLTPNEYYSAVVALTLLVLFAAFAMLIACHEIYHVGIKMALYVLLQTLLWRSTDYVIKNELLAYDEITVCSISYAVSVLLCFAAAYSAYSRKWEESREQEPPMLLFLGVFNILLMLGMIILLQFDCSAQIQALNLVVLFLCMNMNTFHLLRSFQPSGPVGLYIEAKLTVFLIVALKSYDAEGFVVSICCLVLAVLSIAAGLALKYRYIRLYGLILSCLSILKIVLLDLDLDSTMAKALAVLGCGALAFGISFLYNYLDKKDTGK